MTLLRQVGSSNGIHLYNIGNSVRHCCYNYTKCYRLNKNNDAAPVLSGAVAVLKGIVLSRKMVSIGLKITTSDVRLMMVRKMKTIMS